MKQQILTFLALVLFAYTGSSQQTFSWTQIADYPYDAWGMNSCTYNGYLYTFSNCGGGNNTLYRYDPTANKWDTLATLSTTTLCATAISGVNGKLYVAGFGVLHVYDIATASWSGSTINLSPDFRSDGVTAVVIGTDIYYVGGGPPTTANLFKYNTVSQSTTQLASMNTERQNTQAVHMNGKIYVLGGRKAGVSSNTGEVYDIATNTWTNLTATFSNRYFGFAVADSAYIYLMGGETGVTSTKYKTIEVFDPVANSVTILDTTINNMNREHTAYALGVTGTKLIAAAGYSNTPANNDLIKYSESTNFISAVSIMQQVKKSVDFKVYPNPSNGMVYIKLSNPADVSKIELYNMGGALIAKPETNNSKEIRIDCSAFPAGSYIIKTTGKTGSVQAQVLQLNK